jgi:hypothetical protein
MDIINRKSISDDLHKYDYLAKEHSFIEVTEWANGEGWDITIDDKVMSLTYGQLDAIKYLTLALQYQK